MKYFLLVFVLFISGCASGPIVVGQQMRKEVVCPSADTSKCVQSIMDGPRYYVERSSRYIEVNEDGVPNYTKFLGRNLTPDVSPVALYCGGVWDKNPLEEHTLEKGTLLVQDPAVTSTFTFTRTIENKLDIGASIDIDNLLSAAGIPTANGTSEVKAEIRAAIERLKRSEVNFKGVYRFVHLNPTTIAKLKASNPPAELSSCANYLRENDEAITISITGVYITTGETSGSLASKVSSVLKASLDGKLNEAEIANVVSEFENKVNETYSVAFQPVFQVLSAAGFNNYQG